MHAFRQMALALGSVLLISGFALGQASLGPYVVDSNGLKVGHVQDYGQVLMFVDGVPTLINGGSNGFTAMGFVQYFTDGACGTQALLPEGLSSGRFFLLGFYTSDGMVHYANAAALANVTIHSANVVNPDGSMGACTPLVVTVLAAPVLTVSVSAFTPPFSVVDTLPVSPAPATGHVQRRADESSVLPVHRGAVRLGGDRRVQRGTAAVLPGQSRYTRPDGGVSGEGARALGSGGTGVGL